MAGAPAGLPAGVRLSDHISLGVIARAVPPDRVRRVLGRTENGRAAWEAPPRRLYEEVVRPIATRATKGARCRRWRLVSLDGSCLDVADTEDNCAAFGCPGASRGESAFPRLRFAAPVENGTHVLCGARLGGYADGEVTLAHGVLTTLQPGMLCLADRQFFGRALWQAAVAGGADLLWRGKRNLRPPRGAGLADGADLTTGYPHDKE